MQPSGPRTSGFAEFNSGPLYLHVTFSRLTAYSTVENANSVAQADDFHDPFYYYYYYYYYYFLFSN